LKFKTNNIIDTALGVVLGAGIIGAALFIANKYFGLFAYPGLSPKELEKVYGELNRRYKIVSRVNGSDYSRGIYDVGGSLYYYYYTYGQDLVLYPLVFERYTTDTSLLGNPKLTYPK
jgi:hypothetical protein